MFVFTVDSDNNGKKVNKPAGKKEENPKLTRLYSLIQQKIMGYFLIYKSCNKILHP